MGLRLVISLVEQLSGTIELDQTAGTTFTIVVKEKEWTAEKIQVA
jgi:two-component sensor histidine kinase